MARPYGKVVGLGFRTIDGFDEFHANQSKEFLMRS
jgi:hypothetical protein